MSHQPQPQASSSRASPSTTPAVTDLYRPLALQIQRAVAPLTNGNPISTSLPALLGTDTSTYNSRLSGKTVLLADIPSAPSTLVTGRKRNRGDPKALAAAKAEQAAISKRPTRTARRAKAVLNPQSVVNYASILPLHYLHLRYIAQLLNLPPAPEELATAQQTGKMALPAFSPESVQSKIVKADLTGAKLSVVAAKNPSLIGLAGILLEETAGSFRLVSVDGKVRVVPKVGAQFCLSMPVFAAGELEGDEWAEFEQKCPKIEAEILGGAFAYRSEDRAGRKFKPAQGGGGGSGWGEEWVKSKWGELLGPEAEGSAPSKRRKRNKFRRKDPLAFGSVQVF